MYYVSTNTHTCSQTTIHTFFTDNKWFDNIASSCDISRMIRDISRMIRDISRMIRDASLISELTPNYSKQLIRHLLAACVNLLFCGAYYCIGLSQLLKYCPFTYTAATHTGDNSPLLKGGHRCQGETSRTAREKRTGNCRDTFFIFIRCINHVVQDNMSIIDKSMGVFYIAS